MKTSLTVTAFPLGRWRPETILLYTQNHTDCWGDAGAASRGRKLGGQHSKKVNTSYLISMKYYFNPIHPTLIYIIYSKYADKTVIDYLIYTEIYIHYDLEYLGNRIDFSI